MATLRMRTRADKSAAYEALGRASTLRDTIRKYRYHEHKQRACMAGEFTIHNLPFEVLVEIERELAPYWTRGKMRTDEV